MEVQSINSAIQNNKIYSSEPNLKVEYNFNQPNQIKDEFAYTKNFNKKVSFGASVEEYAQRYLHASNFESALRAELWDKEVNIREALGDIFTNKATNRVNNKINEIKSRIKEMLNDIAEKDRKKRLLDDEIDRRQRDADAALRREKEAEKQLREERALSKKKGEIEKKRTELELESAKLDIEEENLKIEKELLQEQKFGSFVEILKDKFIKLAQMANIEKTQNDSIDFPNGIMLSGLEKEVSDDVISWIAKKSGFQLKKVDFTNSTPNETLENLDNIANVARKNKIRTLIQIDNIEKFTIPTEENEKIIGKLKNFFQSCAEKDKCTIITNVENPNDLAPEITAVHRFPIKISVD